MRMPFQRVESRIASNHLRPYPVLGHPTLSFYGSAQTTRRSGVCGHLISVLQENTGFFLLVLSHRQGENIWKIGVFGCAENINGFIHTC